MKGSLRQRSEGTWELRVFHGRDPVSGLKRYTSKTVRGGKRDAQRALATMINQAPESAPTRSMTVADALERWFDHAQEDLSPSTQSVTRMIIDKHLGPHIGSVPLSALTPARVDNAYRAIGRRGGRGGKPLAPATVHRAHNVLHRAMAQAARWGWLPSNPVSLATPPRRTAPEIRPPETDEVMRLFALAQEKNPAFATYVQLAAATGARRGELVALRWSDLDLDAGVVRIRRGIVHGLDGLAEKDTKTHTSRRIAIDAGTIEALRRHRAVADEVAAGAGAALSGDCFVFSDSPDGMESWNPAYITQAFARLAKRAGVPEVRLHDLRHFVATRLLANGVDIRTVAGRLGHRNPNVTLNVYAHFLPEADRDAADLLGRLLAPPADNGS
ncbi:MAG: site-specific integrase [Actinomycetota bacterium]